ncbi:MAG TPA: hypothetical protein VK736_06200 [Candidatus Binatia bacterium]|nr:hypothetical protein [Candidatus Binatia bacterium]
MLAIAALLFLASLVMPIPPPGVDELESRPLAQCGANWGIYQKLYDLNPATQAALAEIGVYEMRDGRPLFQPSIVVFVQDDAGLGTVYVREKDGVKVYTVDAFAAKYNDPCKLPGAAPGVSA